MPNNGAYNNQAANAGERNVGPVGLTRLPVAGQPPALSTDWLSHSQTSRATSPLLRFTDLVSGPATGIGDGVGSGVIVTVWGQGIGDSKGASKAYFTDNDGTKRECATYYWKRADGTGDSGPSRLWYSHLMQEVALSIPAGSVDGAGTITLEVGGVESNAMPFTVRSGAIYHVKSSGSDNNDGSFSSPWATLSKVISSAVAGATTYVHDVDTGSDSTARGVYWNTAANTSSMAAQWSIVAYPGFQPKVTAQRGFENYNTEGMVVSKMTTNTSNYISKDSNGQPTGSAIDSIGDTWGVQSSRYGRCVGCRLTEIPGGISSKTAGAIYGTGQFGRDRLSDFKIFGNEIHDYGDAGSSKLHHTTYIQIRSNSGLVVNAWEWGFNFLHENAAKFGIHHFDQNVDNGDINGVVRVHNNVIVEQGGAGLSCGATNSAVFSNNWEWENNVLINTGLAADWDGFDPDTSDGAENAAVSFRDGAGTNTGLTGTHTVKDNLIWGVANDGQTIEQRSALGFTSDGGNITVDWSQNASILDIDTAFVAAGFGVTLSSVNYDGEENGWYYSEGTPSNAVAPLFDANPISSDPQITRDGSIIIVASGSPLKSQGLTTGYDIYGAPRPASSTIGPVEAS